MRVITLSLRYREAPAARAWLEHLPGSGKAYITDMIKEFLPQGGQRWLFPGAKTAWVELPRPGDKEQAAILARQGADLLYVYPSRKRRRLFVRQRT